MNQRQQVILNLVRTKEIYTQAELTAALKHEGITAAQATISRDIRKLGLLREPTKHGLKYTAGLTRGEESQSLSRVFRDGMLSVDYAGNMMVLHTISGMAMAVALALDKMKLPEILGTVAGDDVIICVVRSEEKAKELVNMLSE